MRQMRSMLAALLTLVVLASGCGGEGSMTTRFTVTAGVGGHPKAGEALFNTHDCGFCHTLAAANANGTTAPNLDESKPSFALARDLIANGRGAMPAYEDQLSARQIEDLAAFVAQASRSG